MDSRDNYDDKDVHPDFDPNDDDNLFESEPAFGRYHRVAVSKLFAEPSVDDDDLFDDQHDGANWTRAFTREAENKREKKADKGFDFGL